MKFSCPHCQQHLEADDSFAGTTVDCPTCGKSFVVGAAPAADPPPPPPVSDPVPEVPPVPETPATPEPVSVPPPPVAPPPAEPPKAAPKFRVVSRPQDAVPEVPKTTSKFRVVSRPATIRRTTSSDPVPNSNPDAGIEEKVKKSVTNLHERFNDFTGLEKLEGFSFGALFSEVFGKHKPGDIEDMFTVGTPRATPPIEEVDTSWPKPWLFFRALAASIILYLLFGGGFQHFENPNLIPGMILMGTLAVPLSTLLFFYEVNARRNVSLYQVLRLFSLGGILSLLIALFLFEMPGKSTSETTMLFLAGPIEETGKLLALLLVARSARYPYKLNGLLMGAAIGTGFAVFESMGYALNYLIVGVLAEISGEAVNSIELMKSVIVVRGVLSPLGHIVWTAIAGAALWRVKGPRPFQVAMLGNGKFWHLFLVPVVLHSLWDVPIGESLPYYGKYLLLGFVAWFVAIALVQEGLKELRAEKIAALENVSGADSAAPDGTRKSSKTRGNP